MKHWNSSLNASIFVEIARFFECRPKRTVFSLHSLPFKMKDQILSDIRAAIKDIDRKNIELPSVPYVWKLEGLGTEEKTERFRNSTATVQGELIECANRAEMLERIREIFRELKVDSYGITDHPFLEGIISELDGYRAVSKYEGVSMETGNVPELANLDAAIHAAEYLLADTGSCVIAAQENFERLLCYLPPLCIVLADKSILAEHLPEVWPSIINRLNGTAPDSLKSGEFVIVSGPSRTADIEKILILGVHGPKRLIVLLTP